MTIPEQVNLLKSRNLIIKDREIIYSVLTNVSYFRFSAYFHPFVVKNDPGQKFMIGTEFEDILGNYSFDRKLRLLVFDAIERIEIAFRTRLTVSLVEKYGPGWYHNANLFKDSDCFFKTIENFKKEYGSSNEVFIKHFKEKYSDSEFPPSWIALEIFSFGRLSRHFSNLKNNADKQLLADYFELRYPVLQSWLHSLSYVRNICAHHSRLWNRSLGIRPVFPSSKNFYWLRNRDIHNNRSYYLLCILQYILNEVHTRNTFKSKLQSLLSDYPGIDKTVMGFPKNWEKEPLWEIW